MAVAAAAAGLLAGGLGRDLPVALASAVLPSGETTPCGMEEVLECTLRDLPDVFGDLLILGLVVVGIDVVLALVGVVLVILGGRRLARARREEPGVHATSEGQDWPGLGLVGVGVALVVPGFWLAGSSALYLVSGRSG